VLVMILNMELYSRVKKCAIKITFLFESRPNTLLELLLESFNELYDFYVSGVRMGPCG
jgi:hypothetical protein